LRIIRESARTPIGPPRNQDHLRWNAVDKNAAMQIEQFRDCSIGRQESEHRDNVRRFFDPGKPGRSERLDVKFPTIGQRAENRLKIYAVM
jgi:hypothetical protein